MSAQISGDGRRLYDAWRRSETHFENCLLRAEQADEERAKANDAFAKFMVPKDAKPGEKFSISHGSDYLEVTYRGADKRAEVTVRPR